MRYALISGDTVVNVIVLDGEPELDLPAGQILVASNTAEIGDTWTGGAVVPQVPPPPPPLPPRWGVMTYTIVRRLQTAGVAAAALAMLDANPIARIKFLTTQWIWSDDPEATALIAAAGAVPADIMARDPYWLPV